MGLIPRVSIVVPSRTGQVAVLKEQLAHQSLRGWELIVRSGIAPPSRARNLGAREARAETLVFLDDDIQLGDPHLLADLVEALGRVDPSTRTTASGRRLARDSAPRAGRKAPRALPMGLHAGSVVGVWWRLLPTASLFQRWQVAESFGHPVAPVTAGMAEVPWDSLGASCIAIRRRTFEALGGFDELLVAGEDPELCYRITRAGGRVCVLADRWIYREPPRTLLAAARKTIWYEWGNAQVAQKHPASGYRMSLRSRWHAAGYLLLRTGLLAPLMFIKVSYRDRRPRPAFRPLATLLSYLGAWAYCLGWFASLPARERAA